MFVPSMVTAAMHTTATSANAPRTDGDDHAAVFPELPDCGGGHCGGGASAPAAGGGQGGTPAGGAARQRWARPDVAGPPTSNGGGFQCPSSPNVHPGPGAILDPCSAPLRDRDPSVTKCPL